MSIRVALHHQTLYQFDRPVSLSPHAIRLRPAPHSRTPILSYSLRVEPAHHFLNWQQDPFGNYLARLVFPDKARSLHIDVEMIAEMTVINPFDFYLESYADEFPFEYPEQLARELVPYRELRESGPQLMGWLQGVDRSRRRTVDFLVDLNARLQRDVGYSIRMEPGIQSCEHTLTSAVGSCRDSAWLLVQILRHLGLAARFVSGYLVQLTPDVKSLDGPSGPEQDFTDLHAWAELYVPGAGWLGLDPTSGLFAGEGHIPLACTPDPVSAAPVTGATGPCETHLEFHNRVQRIHEDPRVTRPYTEDQWEDVMALGRAVDRDLAAGDVRLTMGGEPTFVSVDDMDGAEWTIAAMGPTKRRLALDLLDRLYARFAPGGVLQYDQGKWYPGEMLPRWALFCFWRADGGSVWKDQALLGDERHDYGHGPEQARAFVQALAARLGLDPACISAGHEDVFYYLWKEARLPANVDPLNSRLRDPLERRRLVDLFEGGLDRVAGYALPLRREQGGWRSSRWRFRHGHMFLLPGDSSMGYRLPTASLPWAQEAELEVEHPRDPFEERPALGDARDAVARRHGRFVSSPPVPEAPRTAGPKPAAHESPRELVRTALCVQARHGRLHVFLPPATDLEHYLELVAAVEDTAAELAMPVVLEGYAPPQDPRLLRLSVTPDPGVIEVNVHPASSWEQVVEVTEALYQEAARARLGAEKFMLDGRHTGTGGGNHVTLGGPTPADSPLLRRPDLLRSLITYWQHHPSLSYLFSGLFVGPTSQAPRVDEARDDSLYELEIAFQQMPEGEVASPWLVDRLLRNLLVDVTGNTHRAEFCIDKLYAPAGPAGRLGLVEMRAFEMPPHPRMSAVQMLLLRALIAWFWKQPYRHRPVRWGTELHDRFLLPHHVWADFAQVICDLREAGYPMELSWFAPFHEFRFPHYGGINADGVELELRMAIEPWHVLGEEVSSQGTARYVDSAVERLQVKVRGLTEGRHVVACNGRRVPLRATGRQGEAVGGVRFKAWEPDSALHPTIGSQAPLAFDIVDLWSRRSVGGCTYHVEHPGGRNPETFPVNAYEAEARRVARFKPYEHTPGTLEPPPEEPAGEHPHTLDLRYAPRC